MLFTAWSMAEPVECGNPKGEVIQSPGSRIACEPPAANTASAKTIKAGLLATTLLRA
jgi:hypothetical protein